MTAYTFAQTGSRRMGPASGTSVAGRVGSAIRDFMRGRVEAYLDAREARRAYRHVQAMTDYQLRDIGLSRAEIKAKVFGPAHRRGAGLD